MATKNRLSPDQIPLSLVVPNSDWVSPTSLPDLVGAGVRRVAIDTETRDDGLAMSRGPGWAIGAGYICGVSVAWGGDRSGKLYVPLRHPDTSCSIDRDSCIRWLSDIFRSNIEIVGQNWGYDQGWLSKDLGLGKPQGRLHDMQAAAVLLDENRLTYNLNDLCKWQGIPGKSEALLREAALAYGCDPKAGLWRLPGRFVGPYAEADAVATLALADQMLPQIEAQGLEESYRLECDLIPMVHDMRARGVRIDEAALVGSQAELRRERDGLLAELGARLPGRRVPTVHDIVSPRWLEGAFGAEGLSFPRTQKTQRGSFESGKDGWMVKHSHWLPQGLVKVRRLNEAAEKFLGTYIGDYVHRGRLHAEIHQLRGDEGGTRTYRFSYSDPPLQQMPSRDKRLGPLIRGCFLPEEGEIWGALDYSQQEYRLIVHFADACGILGASKAVGIYHDNPAADFHQLVADWTGLDRKPAKDTNFAKAFGAGVGKFALMTGKSEDEARAIMEQYDREMPFVKGLSDYTRKIADRRGYIRLLDGARSRFDLFEPGWDYKGQYHPPVPHAEARARVASEGHDWYEQKLRRAYTHKAMNRLIQGSAARQTKMAMRACYREGFVPLLQMHDEMDFSLTRKADGEMLAGLMKDVCPLRVPMKVDAEYGRSWGDATHSWAEIEETPGL